MRIQIEFDPNENTAVTPLLFAQAVIDYWYSDVGFAKNDEIIARVNLRESARHIIEFLDAEECRLDIKRGSNERRW